MASRSISDYIHFQKENFLKTREAINKVPDAGSLSKKIEKQYLFIAKEAQARQLELQSLTPVANDLLSLFATAQNMDTLLSNSGFGEEVEQKVGLDVELRDMSVELARFSSQTKQINGQIEALSTLLNNMDGILSHLDQVNGELIEYCANLNKQQESVNASFLQDGQLHILNINPTAVSSLKSLQGRLNALRSVAAIGSGRFPKEVSYINSKGERATTSVFGLVYSLRQLIINILGGYGEALSTVYAMTKAEEMLEQAFGKNPNIVIGGTGTKKLSNGQTAKSDVQLNYSEDNVNLTIGISAKAQLLKSNKTTITTFQTSKLAVFLRGIEKNLEYNFLNNLYHGRTSANEQILLNRYIAAMNFDNAVTGWNLGDKVMFLSYLDRVISISDFYNMVIKAGQNSVTNYPSLSIPGVKTVTKSDFVGDIDATKVDEIIDNTPAAKAQLAWDRSDAIRKALLGINSQIQFKH